MYYNDNGEIKPINVKASDTLPIGTIVNYDGTEVPSGYVEVEDYSTYEVKTGSNWIDGKPIYRKVVELNGSQVTSNTRIDLSDLNKSEILKVNTMLKKTNGIADFNNYYWGENDYIRSMLSGDILVVRIATSDTISKLIVIIEYTKITD